MRSQRWLQWLLVAAGVLVMAGVCTANERIRFKNGRTIVAVSSRVDGDFIYLRMQDGSEVGFPQSLVAETEQGSYRRTAHVNPGFGGRGPSARQTMAYRRNMVAAGKMPTSLSSVARKVRGGELNSVGFSYRGSGWGTSNDASRRPRPLNILNPADRLGNGATAAPGSSAPPPRNSRPTTTGPRASTRTQRTITPKMAPATPHRKGRQVDNSGKF